MCGEADRAVDRVQRRDAGRQLPLVRGLRLRPGAEDVAFLERELGGDAPVDVGLRGGETLRLGPGWRVEVLALPGHTPGPPRALGPRSGAAIIIDAVLADGVYDRAGNRLIPPRYYDGRRPTRRRSAGCARSTRSSCSPRTTR
jgi:glyoxylase-like metal-dependent hydrolase (beta-lactamase superfamily II)